LTPIWSRVALVYTPYIHFYFNDNFGNPKVKELLKSVHIYQSYRKNKSGTLFMAHVGMLISVFQKIDYRFEKIIFFDYRIWCRYLAMPCNVWRPMPYAVIVFW